MHLVPIPTTPEYLNASFELWSPFLPHIAARSPGSVDELLGKVHRREVQPILVMDGTTPAALIGVSIIADNGERVGVVAWVNFKREYYWRDVRSNILLTLESYLRDHVKC